MRVVRLAASVLWLALVVGCGGDRTGGTDELVTASSTPGGSQSHPAGVTVGIPVRSEPASSADRDETTTAVNAGAEQEGGLQSRPAVVIHAGDQTLTVSAHTYGSDEIGVVDGTYPSRLPDVGEASELFIEFPLRTWTFSAQMVQVMNGSAAAGFVEAASALQVAEESGRVQTVTLEQQDDGRWRLGATGPAGTYDVWLMGTGEQEGGDFLFRWTVTNDSAPSVATT